MASAKKIIRRRRRAMHDQSTLLSSRTIITGNILIILRLGNYSQSNRYFCLIYMYELAR